MKHHIIRREEMLKASLDLGGDPISLADYATTGLMAVAVGPRGMGKTNGGLLIGEQLAKQGWVSVLIDPESELESLFGEAVRDPAELGALLESRQRPIVVVRAADATEFLPYGKAILEVSDRCRQPLYVMIDEGQIFSAPRNRAEDLGAATDIINELCGRGRKRALDLYITALRYANTLHRSLFANKNLTLIGCQEDPSAWSALAPQFRSSGIDFADLNALAPGEFFCLSRRGIEKVRMPMADALAEVAPKAKATPKALPATFTAWDRALRAIPTDRLQALEPSVVSLLGAIAGLSTQQMLDGAAALSDELEVR